MDVLKLAAAALLAACYEPSLPDCVVACSSSSDCAPGQACTADGYCAAPGLACAGPDAPRPDASLDAPSMKVLLRVRIERSGRVEVKNVGTCDSATGGDCTYAVAAGAPLELEASPHPGYRFERWVPSACGSPLCTMTPVAPQTEIRARFKKDD